jgi:hypothetical protein
LTGDEDDGSLPDPPVATRVGLRHERRTRRVATRIGSGVLSRKTAGKYHQRPRAVTAPKA